MVRNETNDKYKRISSSLSSLPAPACERHVPRRASHAYFPISSLTKTTTWSE